MDSISEQAARWAIRADSGLLEDSERRELEEWLAADPRHRGAYVRAWAYWTDLDRLATLSGPAPASLSVHPGGVDPNRRRLLAAAGVAAFTAAGGLSWYLLSGKSLPAVPAKRYASDTGEIRRVLLEDGSELLLNTQSVVSVQFSARQRTIQLLRGEVLFKVTHSPTRPFIVNTRNGAVRAVGTAFGVRIDSNQANVTVTEGVVEVVNSPVDLSSGKVLSQTAAGRTRVSALQRVIMKGEQAPQVQAISPAEADQQFAWREGMVFFKGESLETAISQINRYNTRQIVVDDLKLASTPIVGIFRATDPDGFSAAVAAVLKAKVITEDDVIWLEPRASSSD